MIPGERTLIIRVALSLWLDALIQWLHAQGRQPFYDFTVVEGKEDLCPNHVTGLDASGTIEIRILKAIGTGDKDQSLSKRKSSIGKKIPIKRVKSPEG